MSDLTFQILLALGAAASVFVTVLAFWMVFGASLSAHYNKLCEAYETYMVVGLQFPDKVHLVLGGYLAAVAVMVIFFWIYGPLLVPVVLFVAYLFPKMLYTYVQTRRRKRIDDILPGVLQQLSANMKNVGSIGLALQEVSRTAPAPMNYELELISRQERELIGFGKALSNARERVGSAWFDVMTSVLIVSEEKGGHASASLANLAGVFTQLKAMQNDIDTATSQGRMSMRLMLAMPFFIVGGVYMFDPDTVALAVSNTAGKIVLFMALFFYLLSVALAFWLSKVKI
jgi:Flp pilus assembly protein TadB